MLVAPSKMRPIPKLGSQPEGFPTRLTQASQMIHIHSVCLPPPIWDRESDKFLSLLVAKLFEDTLDYLQGDWIETITSAAQGNLAFLQIHQEGEGRAIHQASALVAFLEFPLASSNLLGQVS